MSKAVGRKDPEDSRLREAQLIFQVGLKKEWAQQCSYWIELYCKQVGKKNKVNLFFVYRQWSFWKKATNEVVDGGIVSEAISSLPSAEQLLVDYVRMRTEEKGDCLEYVKEHEDWKGIAARVSAEVDLREAAALRTKIQNRKQTLAEKFKETQREREKKADW